jgi:hypothetical protein
MNNPKLGDDQKWKLYQQNLHRMIDLSKECKPIKVQIDKSKDDSHDGHDEVVKQDHCSSFLTLFTKPQKEHANMIFQFLSQYSDDIKWDKVGRVILNGEVLEGSHIVEFIRYLIKSKSNRPKHWESFAAVLKDLNIPLELISNPTARKLINKQLPSPAFFTPGLTVTAADSPSYSRKTHQSTPLSRGKSVIVDQDGDGRRKKAIKKTAKKKSKKRVFKTMLKWRKFKQ